MGSCQLLDLFASFSLVLGMCVWSCLDFLIVFKLLFNWFVFGFFWLMLVLLGCFRWCWLLRLFVLLFMLCQDVEACVSFWLFCFKLLYFCEVVQMASSCLSFFFEFFPGCVCCLGWCCWFLTSKLGRYGLFHVIFCGFGFRFLGFSSLQNN